MRRAARVGVIGFIIVTAAGCVTQAKYDRAVEQRNTIQKDLNVAKAEELALMQEAKMRESLKSEAHTDATAAADATQRAKDEAEAQRRTAEERFATLQRAVSQLLVEQRTLGQDLEDAKEDTVALKGVVAAYRKKMRTESQTGEPAQSVPVALAPVPADPGFAALPQAGSTPDATSAEPPQPVRPLPYKALPQKDQPAEPSEESLLSAVIKWLISLWQSAVSLWHWIFS